MGNGILMLGRITLVLVLVSAVWQDIKERKISNKTIITGLVLGLFFSALRPDITLPETFFGAAAAFAIGYVCWKLKVFRAGDAKLLCVVGAFTGIRMILPCFVYTIFAGALLGVPLFIKRMIRREKGWTEVPFSPAIAAGTLLVLGFGNTLIL